MSDQQPEHETPRDPEDEGGRSGEQSNDRSGGQSRPDVVVVTPQGIGKIAPDEDDGRTNPADLVEQPAKVMRIGSMIKQLLDEVRSAPLDDKGRARLADIHQRSLGELKEGLAPELIDELDRIALPFTNDTPSDAELRIAQAQLVGWLEGLFHGIQTALVAQQMAAQQQLQQMRALPAGHGHQDQPHPQPRVPGMPPGPQQPPSEGTGQYL